MDELNRLAEEFPNDGELGKKVREYVINIKGRTPNKEKLIHDIIKSQIKPLKKLGKQQEKSISKLRKHGYGDIHPFYKDELKSGYSYTHGYSVGHVQLAEHVLELISMTDQEIIELNEENERIKKQNETYMSDLLKKLNEDG